LYCGGQQQQLQLLNVMMQCGWHARLVIYAAAVPQVRSQGSFAEAGALRCTVPVPSLYGQHICVAVLMLILLLLLLLLLLPLLAMVLALAGRTV
jgi:uncharacterized membrane protein